MKNIEIEYKVMISSKDFEKVERNFNNFKVIDQTNYYYETNKKDLKKNGLSFRFRKVDNKIIATLKESLDEGKLEHEYICKTCRVPKEILTILTSYNIDAKKLEKVGKLRTVRKEIKVGNALICLDHSYYNRKQDYEIECEHENIKKAREVIETLLNKLDVKYKESKLSKTARAIKK